MNRTSMNDFISAHERLTNPRKLNKLFGLIARIVLNIKKIQRSVPSE